MISLKKVLSVLLAAVLLAAVAAATPRQVSAGFGSSPGAPGERNDVTGHGFGLTVNITDGTSNTIVTPGSSLLQRKAGGGQQEYIPFPTPPFVPIPLPVSSTR